MSLNRFAYIVQLNLPNEPIKIGQTSSVISRIETFNSATPCELRIVGAALGGKPRERELLEATKDRILKGEWRLVTDALRAMVNEIYLRGEWYVPQRNLAEVWGRHNVKQILEEYDDRLTIRKPSACRMQSHYVKRVVAALAEKHPALGLHICGFDVADHAPQLSWPLNEVKAA